MTQLGQRAKAAAAQLAVCSAKEKNEALEAMAQAFDERAGQILSANEKDMQNAVESGMKQSMQDRLKLTRARIDAMIGGIRQVCAQDDPIGEVVSMAKRPGGLIIGKRRVPLGVIGIIYEARPNVTSDAAVLCLKAGNAVILRGGKEAIHSNTAIVAVMRGALERAGLNPDAVCFVEDTSRDSALAMMGLTGYIDVLIPRGGAGLIQSVVKNARVPVIETGVGNCHVYVDDEADLDMAAKIIFNAKCSRPSVCNAAETLLVARPVAKAFLPMAKALLDTKGGGAARL